MRVSKSELFDLMKQKLQQAGLDEQAASDVSDVLTFADHRGIHSHGAVRVEYYAERIAKGGINTNPQYHFEQTGPATATFFGDNGPGHQAAKQAMEKAIDIAKNNGVAVVGVKNISHSGALGYFVEMAAEQDMVALSMCQSDPMVVPFGGTEPYFGTNPIAFSSPSNDDRIITFDMATTVQAWGKVLDARAKHLSIPDTWAVNDKGEPTTDSRDVHALVPVAGPKGYGLMMMVDILSGSLLGLPHGLHVSSMYKDLTKGRDLGQLHIVINPAYFTDMDQFKQQISTMLDELKAQPAAQGYGEIYYPGERGRLRSEKYDQQGIDIVDDIYNYLISDDVHYDRYHGKNRFAE
ncbi:ureidoglycolate dehydrogenase [Staphylococcus simiae]|uniref:Ureidoglycolate dehydrogenase n=1 Tax=Staphylococcus simiae CCM 7213 = CCUG 51256 TaxID=911238 RepID=G5JLX8_9STAP|nr:ureidoglycolate dehydrogenase [Staphylococcus simiae]EHJ06807.1 ureidoglycolate dehydrogenase [Staphylococcus simiae CCM 7213 = CCUG 51256]MBO1198740.1 ureidoglycolate dehydrogenase [Staphylococcus simiae]MBO1200992.1 ureidoglycolate dehydrogenase [Staphylococcus simiae]MBO1203163.1 ureidoglycolate dehydrogenase [Staphylococcus simiae]MBO1210729.1 ureidoglycolate dehydrogenase [Staphylococcus simiae]